MKFSSLQENLKQGLQIAGRAVSKNVNLPILNNILIRIEDGNIKLISTNLEIGVTHIVRGKSELDGEFTVDAKIITDYINLLPNKKVDISRENDKLIISADNYKTKIIGQTADDFPVIPEINKDLSCSLPMSEFKKALSQVVFAVSNNETKAGLTGVYVYFQNDRLFLVATDSYRLAEKSIKIKTGFSSELKGLEGGVIIPAKTLQELQRVMSVLKDGEVDEADDDVRIYFSDNQILFSIKNSELFSRLIDGQYPDYRQIIPGNWKTSASLQRMDLIRAVKASSIFSKEGVNDINLSFFADSGKVKIVSASGKTGENEVELEAVIEGDNNSVVVNYSYFLDGLNNINGDNVILEVVDGDTPCIMKSDKKDAYLYLIMPIKQ